MVMNNVSLLKQRGLKATPQRLEILSIMHSSGHVDIDELFGKIIQKFPSISLATLYKNLHIMLDSSLISELKLPNAKTKYELNKAPHAHLLCQKCGSCTDLSLDTDTLISEINKKSGYRVIQSTLIFSGLCPKCQDN